MTSKEALYLLMTNQKKVRDDFTFINLNTHEKVSIEECYDIVIKDLEVLEILKDNLFEEKGTGRFKGINVISCSLGNEHSGRDYYKVKEWLENE